ncbi:MAG: DUF4136 domain-containing protein [Prosthecochloris sp.]|nr:DUF4136 domain-containing protein [Prosthecochloris sp.]
MNNKRIFLFLLLMFSLAGCTTLSVVSDYDRDFDFSGFHTFRWPAENEGIRKGDVLVDNPLVYKRVQSAVNRQLDEKGFRVTGSKEADFIMYAHAGIKKQKSYHHNFGIGVPFGPYRWYRPWWGPYGGYTYVSSYEEGSLVLDVIEARTRELVWRGVATRVVREYRTAEAMQRDINEAVRKILEDFPPGADSGVSSQ